MERGFFKIYRKIEDSKSWSRGVLYRGLMISLLEKANWKRGFPMGRKSFPVSWRSAGSVLLTSWIYPEHRLFACCGILSLTDS